MKFSVLMSVYRREQPAFLHECLQSLHAQTQPAHEIVVVLDGEITQDLQAALDEWRMRLPLKIVPLPHNVGLGKALNAGIEHCTHDYIFRMDSDDIAHPERFALQCAFLRQHPETDLLGGQIAEFDRHIPEDGSRMNMRRVPLTHADIVRFSQKRNPFNHMTVAYRKSSLHRVGGYRHHLWMEDYNLWLRMLAAGMQCANLPQTLVYARTGCGMIGRRKGWRYIHSEWQLYRLKRRLALQTPPAAFVCFAQRALPRLLPSALLQFLYNRLRQNP